MLEQFLPAIAIAAVVIIVMIKQINQVTDKIDANAENFNDPKLYSNFAAVIQEKIRAIRLDIDGGIGAKFTLLEGADKAKSLETLSDMIRQLVFFETMIGRSQNAKSTEAELFTLLQNLDGFIVTSLENGETLADEIREELANTYEQLKNAYFIQQM